MSAHSAKARINTTKRPSRLILLERDITHTRIRRVAFDKSEGHPGGFYRPKAAPLAEGVVLEANSLTVGAGPADSLASQPENEPNAY